MRFMVLVKATTESDAGTLPEEKDLIEMGRFNDELMKAGVMLAAEGLQSSAKGKRIRFDAGAKPRITDGPFAETKELVAGFWIVQVESMEECVEWFRRAPFRKGEEIEIRPVFDAADFEPVIKTDEGRALFESRQEFRKSTGMGG